MPDMLTPAEVAAALLLTAQRYQADGLTYRMAVLAAMAEFDGNVPRVLTALRQAQEQ